jgi:acetylornithine deacetylase/succinyl-diaminopimelate desuccinylase-like protein
MSAFENVGHPSIVTCSRIVTAMHVDRNRLLSDLERLVAIPSIAFAGFPREPLDEAAALVETLLREVGATTVERVAVPGEAPTLLADFPGDGPTVLLYAHYDVQPAPVDGWDTDPFSPTRLDGRVYGRGAADDKSGIVAHLAALRALDGKPPVHVKVLVEGSEENGRQALLRVVDEQPELLRADVMVIADNGNWKVGEPTLSQTLRGHGKLTVTLRTLSTALHSGHFGGAAPDALLALTRLIATLHHDDGSVAVEGLEDSDWDGAEWPEADFRRQAGVLDGVQLVGTGNLSDRVWARHAISVLGLDAPAVDGAGNIVIPHARAKIAVRVPPGADPVRSMETVERHLRARVPWGAQIEIEVEPASTPIALPPVPEAERALEQAFGKPVAMMGSGGSVPLVAKLHATYPDARIILWGAQDSDLARIHAANESVAPSEIAGIAQAEALLLDELSRG